MKPAIDPKQLLARISKLVVLSYAVDWVFIMYATPPAVSSLYPSQSG